MSAVGLAAGALALLMAGDATARLLRIPSASPGARLARSFLLGAGVQTLALLLLLRAGVPLAVAVLALAACAAAAWLLAPAAPAAAPPRRHTPLARLFALLLALEVAQGAAAALVPPLTAWDSWVSWWSKARGIALDGTLTANLLGNADRLPTNASYPLLVPLTESWLLSFAPEAGERAAGAAALLFHAALLLLLLDLLRRSVPETAALGLTLLFAASPRVFRMAPLGMADVPLAAFVVLAFSLLPAPGAPPSRRAAAAVGVAAGLLPWTKEEGWIWLALVLLALATLHGARPLAAALPIAAGLGAIWPAARSPWPSHPYVFGAALHPSRAGGIALRVARCLLSPAWSFVWPLALVAAILAWRALRADERVLVAAPLLFLAAVSAAWLFSRFEPWTDHVRNAVDRLALQGFALAVAGLGASAARAGWIPRREET